MTRMISIPGLQPRTARGQTGADQFLAQVESGYKIGIYAPAAATLTPFARFQTSTVTQASFTETGANSLNLNAWYARRRAGGRGRCWLARQARGPVPAGLGARICRHVTAGDGGLRRRAQQQLYRLWHDTSARQRGPGILGQYRHCRQHFSLYALRRRSRHRYRQPLDIRRLQDLVVKTDVESMEKT